MLEVERFNAFIGKANQAYQQFCVWVATNNEFFKHQERWNNLDPGIGLFGLEDFTRKHGARYKNFFGVVIPTLQHSWVLATARLFDPAYHHRDIKRVKPRLSLEYILAELGDKNFSQQIQKEQNPHQKLINSLKEHRDNFHAHNDVNFTSPQIKAGIEDLFEWLEDVISMIKKSNSVFNNCNSINLEYNQKLAQCGVDEIFEDLLRGEKYGNQFPKNYTRDASK